MKSVFALVALMLGPLADLRAADAPAPVRELLRHDFATVPQKPWMQPHGFWKAEGGALCGSENPAEKHGASVKGFASFRDGTFGYEVRFDGGRVHTLGINQPRDHLFHVDFKPSELLIVKNDLDKDGPDKPEVLARTKLSLEQGRWYAIRVDIHGESVDVQIGDRKLSATQSYIGREKGSFNLYVNGSAVCFRDFHLSTSQPASKP